VSISEAVGGRPRSVRIVLVVVRISTSRTYSYSRRAIVTPLFDLNYRVRDAIEESGSERVGIGRFGFAPVVLVGFFRPM